MASTQQRLLVVEASVQRLLVVEASVQRLLGVEASLQRLLGVETSLQRLMDPLALRQLLDTAKMKALAVAQQPPKPEPQGGRTPLWGEGAIADGLLVGLQHNDLAMIWGDSNDSVRGMGNAAADPFPTIHDQRDAVLRQAGQPEYRSLCRIFRYVHNVRVGTAAGAAVARAAGEAAEAEAATLMAIAAAAADAAVQAADDAQDAPLRPPPPS